MTATSGDRTGILQDRQPIHARPAPTLWGMDALGLHDRRWASRGVQVVRPGGQDVQSSGPQLFLLLDESSMALFRLRNVVKRLNWMKPRALRIRVVDEAEVGYIERAVVDDNDRLMAIRREYRPRTRGSRRVVITGDARVARIWRNSAGGRDGWRAIVDAVGRQRTTVFSCRGRLFDAHSQIESDEFMSLLLDRWPNPGAVLEGVYEYQPRVCVHESVRTPPSTRIIPPVWIGAGARLDDDAVIIGPRMIADAPEIKVAAAAIDWQALRYRSWTPRRSLRGRGFRISKRLFDIVFSLAVLLATAPLYPIVVLAIAISDGWPPFFAHKRQTLRGREFPCYKFRTMRKNAENLKAQLVEENVCDGPQFYIEKDPRIFPVGRLLRRLNIDELPQFWNVLLGHMSVVGPRPSPDSENQFCPAWRESRLSVRPGVTGLWQIRRTREPETDFQEWIRYDLEYVQRESWRLDIWIIFKTIEKIVKG